MNQPPRTGEYASNPRKKNTPCISSQMTYWVFWRGEISFEKGKGVFLSGFYLQVFGQCGGLQCGLGFAKTIFWGKDLAKPRLNFPARRKGSGE